MFRFQAFLKVFVRFFWLIVWWALAGAASAQEFGRLYADSVTLKLAQPLEWLAVPKCSIESPNAFVNASQTPARAWAFRPYLSTDALPTSDTQEVWVRFSLPATALSQTWFVRVPRLTIGRVDFFQASEQGLWTMESAGESIAPAHWALPTRSPTFEVKTRTDTSQTYYMRFAHRNAVTELPMLIAPIEYVDGASRVGTAVGLLWGLFGLLAVVSVATYALLRNTVFLWFGGFVLTMLLTQLVLMGYASWRIWPHSVYLSQVMNWVAPAMALALGTWFIAKASYAQDAHPLIYRFLAAVALGSVVLGIVSAANLDFVSRDIRNIWAGIVVMSVVGSLAWTALRGQSANGWLLLGMGPIALGVLLRLAYNFGWVRHAEFAQAVGILSSSLGLLWMFLVLAWRSRASMVALERSSAAQTFDAATGLLHARIGQMRLPLLLQRGARFETGCGVIMLRWLDYDKTVSKLNAEMRGAALARLGLILRRLARDIDSVVRHDDHDFLIFVEGPVSRESLLALCSKVLSECLRSAEKVAMPNLFNLHTAIWQAAHGTSSATEVMEALQTRLSHMAHGTQRRVQFVDVAISEPHADTDWDINARKEDVIAKINAIEASPIVPTVALRPRAPSAASFPASSPVPVSAPAPATS
jgi:two-component system, sensor histidine kinase LadS